MLSKNFFLISTRPELLVQLKLQEGASLKDTEQVARQFAEELNNNSKISLIILITREKMFHVLF